MATQGVGGTEATVVRVAEELARDLGSSIGGRVVVLQRGRKAMAKHNAIYAPLNRQWETKRWDAVIVLRAPALLPVVKEQCPSALLVWWLHDLADKRLSHPAIIDAQPFIVTASEFHREHVTDGIKRMTPKYFPQVVRIYNPIDEDLCRDDTPIDRNKLIFFSSPHKGLEWTLKVFGDALQANPAFRLYVANPGYFASHVPKEHLEAIRDLGILPHKEVIRHVREALCVFYLNHVFPETFGLIMAEANAVGTPVLTHALGAAREVLHGENQLLDVREPMQVVERLMQWHKGGRPKVEANEQFRLTNVVKEWKSLLDLPN